MPINPKSNPHTFDCFTYRINLAQRPANMVVTSNMQQRTKRQRNQEPWDQQRSTHNGQIYERGESGEDMPLKARLMSQHDS